MTSALFLDWLKMFGSYIGRTVGRKAAPLIDNCSAHGTNDNLLIFDNVGVIYLPPNTTSMLQPLDDSIIVLMKLRYRCLQMERAIGAVDDNVEDICKVDVITGIIWMKKIWQELSISFIQNPSKHTGILRAEEEAFEQTSIANLLCSKKEALERHLAELVPSLVRMGIAELLNSAEDVCKNYINKL